MQGDTKRSSRSFTGWDKKKWIMSIYFSSFFSIERQIDINSIN